MADLQHETAKRSGDLAAQLAAEVRAGRPERCRLRAYCGCPHALCAVGGPHSNLIQGDYVSIPDDSTRVDSDGHCIDCGWYLVHQHMCGQIPLPDWLTGLARLAWAPPLWVPCGQHCTARRPCCVPGGHHESYSHPCLRCGDPERGHAGAPGRAPANVDPAQWVLAVADCGVARAVLPKLTTLQGYYVVERAIEAAEQWTRCPCRECLMVWQNAHDVTQSAWLLRPDGNWDAAGAIQAAAQIIGPDAAREAAARAVLTALED